MDAFAIVGAVSVPLMLLGKIFGGAEVDESIDATEVPYLKGDIEKEAANSRQGLRGQAAPKRTIRISVVDITRDGSKAFPEPASLTTDPDALQTLPELDGETTRLVLSDVFDPVKPPKGSEKLVFSRHLHNMHNLEASHGSVLTYDQADSNKFSSEEARTYSFDVWDLQNLWRPSSHPHHRPLVLQNNVHESLLRETKYIEGSERANRRVLILGQHAVPFWECFSTISARFSSNDRVTCRFHIETYEHDETYSSTVKCDFTALPVNFITSLESADGSNPNNTRQKVHHGFNFSPLKHHFLLILASESSATSIPQKSSIIASQMVTLDLLRAVMECWMVFLTQILLRTSGHTSDLDTRSRAFNLEALRDFSKTARDMELAFQYTLDSVFAALDDNDSDTKPRLKMIGIESFAKLRTIKNRVDDFLSTLDSISTVKTALTDEGQALSVKRLTLLAAVFLPLSLASSLLSMGSRAADLGILWYDYFGICFLLVFVVWLVYQLMRAWDMFKAVQPTKTAQLLDRIKKKRAFRFLWKAASMVMQFLIMPRWEPLKWTIMRSALNYGFIMTIISSFWVGMFKDVNLGWRILAFGAAAWAGCLLTLLLLQFGMFAWKVVVW